jgi:hypothetical protein
MIVVGQVRGLEQATQGSWAASRKLGQPQISPRQQQKAALGTFGQEARALGSRFEQQENYVLGGLLSNDRRSSSQ